MQKVEPVVFSPFIFTIGAGMPRRNNELYQCEIIGSLVNSQSAY